MSAAATNAGLAQLLSRAERRMTQRLERLLRVDGVSLSEWRVLSCLADESGRPMSEVAEFALLPPPTLTKVVDRMVAENLVYRGVDARDRRRVLIYLTRRGRVLHGRLHDVVENGHDDLRRSYGPQAFADLNKLLIHLIEHVDDQAAACR